MTATSIVKELARKRIPGRHRPLFLDRRAGRRDYQYSQISQTEDGIVTTPWVTGMYEKLAEYEGLTYNKVDHATESIANAVATDCEELELIEFTEPGPADNKESAERLAARTEADNAQKRERRKQIKLHLATIKSELEMIDVALKHHLQRAENCNQRHVHAYWGGVLRAAGEDGNKDLPACPGHITTTIFGKDVYEEHFDRIMKRVNDALEGGDDDETA